MGATVKDMTRVWSLFCVALTVAAVQAVPLASHDRDVVLIKGDVSPRVLHEVDVRWLGDGLAVGFGGSAANATTIGTLRRDEHGFVLFGPLDLWTSGPCGYESGKTRILWSSGLSSVLASYCVHDDVDPNVPAIPFLDWPLVPEHRLNVSFAPKSKSDSIADLIALLSAAGAEATIKDLTSIHTRLSGTPGSFTAQKWLLEQFKAAGLEASVMEYELPGKHFPGDVVAELKGEDASDEIIVIGAHFDDRARDISDPEVRAPGANDDGSGTTMLVQIAKALVDAKIKFKRTIRLVGFSGEEQGLYGSKAYVEEAVVRRGDHVVAMIQGDMIAQRAEGKPRQIDFSSVYTSSDLINLAKEQTEKYVPDLAIGSNTACCSDQQPFYNVGVPSIAVTEAGGYTIDPAYHTTEDTWDRDDYDIEQLILIARSILATAGTIAEPVA